MLCTRIYVRTYTTGLYAIANTLHFYPAAECNSVSIDASIQDAITSMHVDVHTINVFRRGEPIIEALAPRRCNVDTFSFSNCCVPQSITTILRFISIDQFAAQLRCPYIMLQNLEVVDSPRCLLQRWRLRE